MDTRQSQSYKLKKSQIFKFWNFTKRYYTAHLMKLIYKMCRYEINLASIVEDTDRTRFSPQTDGQTDGWPVRWMAGRETSIPPFNFVEAGGINRVYIYIYISWSILCHWLYNNLLPNTPYLPCQVSYELSMVVIWEQSACVLGTTCLPCLSFIQERAGTKHMPLLSEHNNQEMRYFHSILKSAMLFPKNGPHFTQHMFSFWSRLVLGQLHAFLGNHINLPPSRQTSPCGRASADVVSRKHTTSQ